MHYYFQHVFLKLQHDPQPGAVGVEEDADGVDLLDAQDVVEDALNVLLVFLITVRESAEARSVNDVD